MKLVDTIIERQLHLLHLLLKLAVNYLVNKESARASTAAIYLTGIKDISSYSIKVNE